MPSKPTTPKSIKECEDSLSAQAELVRKRLELLEMHVQTKENEKKSLLDAVEKLQKQNDEDDEEISSLLFERSKHLVDSPSGKRSNTCAIASHEAADEIQRKEKLVQLENFAISSLEKRISRISVEITAVDKEIEHVEEELEEVTEKTGYSVEKQREIIELLQQEDSVEAFLKKGEETYLDEMKRLADLKEEIENQLIEQKSFQELLKNKSAVVEKLLAEQEKNEALRKKIAQVENDIRVTDRSYREREHERDALAPQTQAADAELEVVDAYSKFTQSRLALKQDSDYLADLYDSQNTQLQDLRRAQKTQLAHSDALHRSIHLLQKAAQCLGTVGSAFPTEVKAAMRIPQLATDHTVIVTAYTGLDDAEARQLFSLHTKENAEIREGFLDIIDASRAVLLRQRDRHAEALAEKARRLEELQEIVEKEREIKANDECERIGESIRAARHTEELKDQLGAQQVKIYEKLKKPMHKRIQMQRKLSESAPLH
ncbi:hypothetical protein XU18_2784 [Perkinsela sp. CCAP 1560/4]|nr:hypothetical protein XU18_2784 [Perkinsela sp. CCAP 1560/4]|eukprot:KNH06279.1 hypothetical protein XU18_2784 [Perkinsela sp. CCAP 1560/4]